MSISIPMVPATRSFPRTMTGLAGARSGRIGRARYITNSLRSRPRPRPGPSSSKEDNLNVGGNMFSPFMQPRVSPLRELRRLATEAFGKGKKKEKVVVLGSGWGGYNLARKLSKSSYDVTVISPNSYFSFTPFLASTAVGTLEFRCATEPVRGIKNVDFVQGWADSIVLKSKSVSVESSIPSLPSDERYPTSSAKQTFEIGYDKLVIAVGCYSASFGIPGVREHAHFLKDIRDARAIRLRLLDLLELASPPPSLSSPSFPDDHPEHQSSTSALSASVSNPSATNTSPPLNIAVVGAGPTGVEFAAEVHDFVHADVYRLYPHLQGRIKIRLYDVAPGILMNFDETLRAYAEKKFKRNNIEVRGGSKITAVGPDWIELDGKTKEPCGLLVWSTGLSPNPFVENISGVSRDERTKSIKVDDHLRVLDTAGQPVDGVWAIGDNSMPDSGRLPATAQVASQQATYLSKSLNKQADGKAIEEAGTFKWNNKGSMVFVGDYRAMVDRSDKGVTGPKSVLAGIAAWIIWRSYYVTQAMGWRNKALVPIYWTLAWIFGRDVTRF